MKLLGISDLHLGHEANRLALAGVSDHLDDWLIVAGDVGETFAHMELAWKTLAPRFAKIFWTPGNHELWASPEGPRGVARYDALVDLCRSYGIVTPEDPFETWPGDGTTVIAPLFTLYDYSFRPADIAEDDAVTWARESGVLCSDERLLSPDPFATRSEWCHARVRLTRARLDAIPAERPTVLVSHFPLRYDLARPPRIPRFSIWCGTTLTEDWGARYRASVLVSGHLHLRSTLTRDGIRCEEVSLGYPREWSRERPFDSFLREILPHAHPDPDYISNKWRGDPFIR
ncbi:MAG: metallophosphoesterase [Acidobacteria bacterium]|nr:metallophosphoesterase [Acidobacteriota bacterium]